jgi:putative transposase
MSEGTFYGWQSKYSGMAAPDVRRLKTLEDENGKLQNLHAEQMLNAAVDQKTHTDLDVLSNWS